MLRVHALNFTPLCELELGGYRAEETWRSNSSGDSMTAG